jgi:uncharacterized LabA/DUF88 family protein
MEDAAVLIDAHYLDLISKQFGLHGEKHIDIKELAVQMAKKNNLWLKKVFLYTCPPFQSSKPTSDESSRKAKYDTFKVRIENKGVVVREGRLQKLRVDNNGSIADKFTEKGVDTLFTIDLLRLHRTEIKNAILLTCDTDFVPVIKAAKEDGLKIILYYYEDGAKKSRFSLSYHLSSECDSKVLITKELIEKSALH